jgi:hypothetical protein
LGEIRHIACLQLYKLKKELTVSSVLLGVICGLVFGGIAAAIMIPMTFDDKRAALTAAFINRFAIGFAIGVSSLPVPGWLNGLIFGLLLSLPEAIITKAWRSIIALGAIGGVIIGVIVGTFSS